MEFQPFLQFLANRGVVVLRFRLRGSNGFGRAFRHAADGRLVDAGLEDLDAARAELVRRGVDSRRIAVLGEGPWAGAFAAMAIDERPGEFVAAADLGGDPDPLRQLDVVASLDESARAWWSARLGDPASETAQRDRTRMRFPERPPGKQLFLLLASGTQPGNAEGLAARLALGTAPGERIGFAALAPQSTLALWEFLSSRLATPP